MFQFWIRHLLITNFVWYNLKKHGSQCYAVGWAKCTNCGANLEVDNAKDAAICQFCGTPSIVESAINNYNVTNTISADVVNIYRGNTANKQ